MSNAPKRGPMGRGQMGTGEKAKDFKGSIGKLLSFMKRYIVRFIIMICFAILGTIFNILGPDILGNATTELFNGLVKKFKE